MLFDLILIGKVTHIQIVIEKLVCNALGETVTALFATT